jgi:hypothetical protein
LISSRTALFAACHPERVKRVAPDALAWTGTGIPTPANRAKRIDQWRSNHRRPIDRAMIESIFTRDHGGTSDLTVVDSFADAVLKLDSSAPAGTYLDISANSPVCTPEKLKVSMLMMRGQYDGIASLRGPMHYFARVPHPDKSPDVMPGIAHTSPRSKNWAIAYHALESFFAHSLRRSMAAVEAPCASIAARRYPHPGRQVQAGRSEAIRSGRMSPTSSLEKLSSTFTPLGSIRNN